MNYRSILFFSLLITTALRAPQFQEAVVVLAPYADPKNPGRIVNDTFERGIALQLAELVATKINEKNSAITVVIIKPSDAQSAVEAASYANRLQPSLFCSLSFYQETSPQPQVSLYRYQHEGDLPLQRSTLALYPYDQAHRLFSTESALVIQKMYDSLREQTGLYCNKPHALPYKPLLGIAAPAYGVEIGIPTTSAWQSLAEPLALGILHALTA